MKSEADIEASTRTSDPEPAAGGAASTGYLSVSRVFDRERYEIVAEHGRGGLGRVFRARDRALDRDVAIKELLARNPTSEMRFQREALITAQLEHPGIVPVHEAGVWPDGTPFYAMKLVAGRSLRELLTERTSVAARISLLHHVAAVADAIAYAHGKNIIHRDLKPANIIVGDFGETIVIDWGIAKQLDASDQTDPGASAARSSPGDGITSVGTIVGTPAYMAPEQARGEPVDQRADVFALGAMLWELCSLDKVPPASARVRHRMLRREGIDDDLATIIDKALADDPAQRYRHAGALAADLKAFTSGARIAARSYSLAALLWRWVRRHRALTIATIAAIAVVAAGGVQYVRRITSERDRADAALARLEAQRAETTRAKDALTLQHAELLLHSDPTAASQLLAGYRGAGAIEAEQIRARAIGLGSARVSATTHTRPVAFAQGLPDGSIVTIGDHRLVKTWLDGRSKTLVDDVVARAHGSYAPASHLVAYMCGTRSICLFDAVAERPAVTSPDMAEFAPVSIEFSPDGELLAATAGNSIAVWSVPGNAAPRPLARTVVDAPGILQFIDSETLAVGSGDHLVRAFRLTGDTLAPLATIEASDVHDMIGAAAYHRLAISTGAGTLVIFDARTGATLHLRPCTAAVNAAAFVARSAGSPLIAYGCEDGPLGLWDLDRSAAVTTGRLDAGTAVVSASADGRYALFGGNTGAILVYDAATQLFTGYAGHTSHILQLLPPADGFDAIASGDGFGALRLWPRPHTSARNLYRGSAYLQYAKIWRSSDPVLAVSVSTTMLLIDAGGRRRELEGHDIRHNPIAAANHAVRFAMYGQDDAIELWTPDAAQPRRQLKTDHPVVTAAAYTADDSALISGGSDGGVAAWSPDGTTQRELARLREPITRLRAVPGSRGEDVIASLASGELWRITGGAPHQLTAAVRTLARWILAPDGRWLPTGTSDGRLQLYDLQTGQLRAELHLPGAIQSLVFFPHGDQLAVAADHNFHLLDVQRLLDHRSLDDAGVQGRRWNQLPLDVLTMDVSLDGQWLALLGKDGTLWFYAADRDHWICPHPNTGNIEDGGFSRDGQSYVLTDASGQISLIDMRSLREDFE